MSVDPNTIIPAENLVFVVEKPRKPVTGTKGGPWGEESTTGTKGFLWDDDETAPVPIPLDHLKANMEAACRQVSQMLEDVRSVGQFRLSEITLQVEISAEGGVQFIGTSKVAGKGAITLKFVESAE